MRTLCTCTLLLASAAILPAAKNLEDMAAAVEVDDAHVGVLGIYLVHHLMLALLATDNYFSKSPNWMKKVTSVLESCSAELAALLSRGRHLMFPGVLATTSRQRGYYEDVQQYCRDVRQYLARDQDLGALWWRLAERYQRIAPPPGARPDDWACKIHVALAPECTFWASLGVGAVLASSLRIEHQFDTMEG